MANSGADRQRLGRGVGPNYEPAIRKPMPIRSWQIWNEANFFYFAYPVSPQRYAKLLTISSPAIKAVDPSAKVILTGLFGEPTAERPAGMPAADLPRIALPHRRGSRAASTAIALHPYAVDAETLEELVEELHDVTRRKPRPRSALYITEMGWGSQNDFQQVAFEQGIQGQVKQLQGLLRVPARKPRRLNLKQRLLVLLEGPAGLLQLLRLGRPLPRRPQVQAEARLARLRRAHRRPRPTVSG